VYVTGTYTLLFSVELGSGNYDVFSVEEKTEARYC
jgi:hypothetical protein